LYFWFWAVFQVIFEFLKFSKLSFLLFFNFDNSLFSELFLVEASFCEFFKFFKLFGFWRFLRSHLSFWIFWIFGYGCFWGNFLKLFYAILLIYHCDLNLFSEFYSFWPPSLYYRQMYNQTNGQMDKWTNGQMDKQTDISIYWLSLGLSENKK